MHDMLLFDISRTGGSASAPPGPTFGITFPFKLPASLLDSGFQANTLQGEEANTLPYSIH